VAIVGFCVWAAIVHTNQFTIGIVVGSVLALGAIGLTLIYGILKFAHFAHGDSMMLSGYIAFFALTGVIVGERRDVQAPIAIDMLPGATERIWDFSFGYGLVLAMVVAAAAAVALLLVLERIVYRPLRNRGAGIVILAIASLGIAISLRSLILIGWGPNPRHYVPGIRRTIDLPWGTRIPADQLFIVATAVVLIVLVYLLLSHTRIGRAMRATADNPDLARVSGINTDSVMNWTWAVAGTLIAIAGVLLALQSQLHPQLGFALLLPLFAATLLGGIGSPWGALVGGLIVGITQEVSVAFGFISPGYKFSVAFVILIIVVLLRPRGLFGSES
jgi:branched-chain amino acid transport system permease protein